MLLSSSIRFLVSSYMLSGLSYSWLSAAPLGVSGNSTATISQPMSVITIAVDV